MVDGTSSGPSATGERPPAPGSGLFSVSQRTTDVGLAVVTFVLEVMGLLGRAVAESDEFSLALLVDIPAATYLLLAVSSLALLWRRTRPLSVLAATLGASLLWDAFGLAEGPSLAILVSLYGVGRYTDDDRTSALAVGAAIAVVIVDDLVIEGEQLSVVGLSVVLVVLPWYLGRRVEARSEYVALIEERARYLEREQEAEAQRAVDAERTRIARELHDLVAHRVSMITVQAGAAQTVIGHDPERALRAMEAVEDAARSALEELRQVLGVLRADDRNDRPVHGLADIPDLVREINDAGIDVSLETDDVPEALPARVDLASYRIVQEALTNVVKHAGGRPKAEVRLSADDSTLTIEVTDDGPRKPMQPGSGHGLVGMRERATLLGGSFDAGPRPEGGFRVAARLPLEVPS